MTTAADMKTLPATGLSLSTPAVYLPLNFFLDDLGDFRHFLHTILFFDLKPKGE